MCDKISSLMKTLSIGTIKGGRFQGQMIRMLCATKVLVSSQISRIHKEHPHVQVKDIIRGVLVHRPSHTSRCTVTLTNNHPLVPVLCNIILISHPKCLNINHNQISSTSFRTMSKSNCFGSLPLSILARCPSHIH